MRGNTTAGVAGQTGVSGPMGEQGSIGPTGVQGAVGMIGQWASYREFWFESGESSMRPVDARKIQDIALYMKQNPSLQLGIDTFLDTRDQEMRNRRVMAIRSQLIQAGVPADKIVTGSFGDALSRSNSRVEVLITTAPRS